MAEAVRSVAAVPRLLVAFDFDGVLAPIVDVPSDARPLPETARVLSELAELPDTVVALVSGRGLADLGAVSGFTAPVRLVGSHGGEFDDGAAVLDDEQRARLDALVTELSALVDGEPGVALEAKPAGVAVHVRNAPAEVGARVLAAAAAGPGARPGIESTPGKAVLDMSVMRTSKGSAIDLLRERVKADAVIFGGDDVTDETALARMRPGDVGVKVGEGETAAAYRVADPEAVTELLTTLLAERRAAIAGS
ncbi:trehalose-phosphatase [Pseudonocardia sp. S2-4]|uniref:Trehalose 6-phosphate phosphatase n=1 Tax=Pseudonocardia humida TaxID=2800819 RepID=A0ABT0ZWP6_9PSEU|nr:trehalose-phosphatase [Pseudonocardia humida]